MLRRLRKTSSKNNEGMETVGMMRWLLTYADMITLLLAMFILLYAISKINIQKYVEIMRKAQVIFNKTTVPQPDELSDQLDRFGRRVYEKVKYLVDEKKLQHKVTVTIEERGIRISFIADGVFFDIGKAAIKSEFQDILIPLVPILKEVTTGIRVEGHTCDKAIMTVEFPSNWELSSRRATNVLRFLLDQGIASQRLSVAGYAETRPIAENTSEENRAKNRRVDIIVLNDRENFLEPKTPSIK